MSSIHIVLRFQLLRLEAVQHNNIVHGDHGGKSETQTQWIVLLISKLLVKLLLCVNFICSIN